jgi:putative endonuclease
MTNALSREKQLKNWKREWKNKLVNDFNPDWKDLSSEVGVTTYIITRVKQQYRGMAGQPRNDENFKFSQ